MYSDPGRNMSSKGTDVAEQKSLSGSKHIYRSLQVEVGGEERKGRRSSSNSAESASEILL